MGACSSSYSEWNIDEKWSSQEGKSDEMLDATTGRPVSEQPAGSFTQHTDKFVMDGTDMDSDTATESNLSLKSRSFLHRVNDRVQEILDQSSKDAMQNIDKRSMIGRMFVSSALEASVFIGKNYSENLLSIKNTGNNLTMKQMFDMSEKLIVGQSYEIFGVTPINWEDSSWKHLSLVVCRSTALYSSSPRNCRTSSSVCKAGALVAWMEGHTGGSRFTPTVHPCPV